MERRIKITGDGTPTFYVESLNEHYHSVHGARTESVHIFIDAGLNHYTGKHIHILEIGFGTGLNAWLSLLDQRDRVINYYTIEKYPLTRSEWSVLDYSGPGDKDPDAFFKLHESNWEKWVEIVPGFRLFKSCADLNTFIPPSHQDIIYFDAFGPEVQPELWSSQIFAKLHSCLKPGGLLLSYSVKGSVRRILAECGFKIEKLPGPKGKRHMLRAIR